MATSSIANATLGDLIAFNAQIESLAQAGLLPRSSCFANAEVARTVNYRVASQLALKTAQGIGFAEAFCSASETPDSYRLAFLAWFFSNRSPQSFDLLKGYEPRQPDGMFRKYVWLHLGVICTIAFCVIVLWVWNAVPSLIGMYLQERAELGVGAKMLQFLHEWLPVWAIGIPLVACGVVVYVRRSARQIPLHMSESLRASQQEALMVDFLLMLRTNGSSVEESSQLYQNAIGKEGRLESLSDPETNLDISAWAIHQSNDLKQGWRNTMNAFCFFAAVGGLIVSGVALALFQPLVELLLHLCEHGGL
jgi:hypothetical protein